MRLSIKFFIVIAILQALLITGTSYSVFQRTRGALREGFARDSERLACSLGKSVGDVGGKSQDQLQNTLNDLTSTLGLAFVSVKNDVRHLSLIAGDRQQAEKALHPPSADNGQSNQIFVTYCEGTTEHTEIAVGRGFDEIISAETSLRKSFQTVLAIQMTLLLLLAAAVAYFVHRRTAMIALACEKISGGQLEARIPVYGSDEISQIAKHINEMAEKLAENQRIQGEQVKSEIHRSKFAALGEMAGGVAHEINNPLSIILLRVDMLKSAVKNSTTTVDGTMVELNKISDVVARIARIVRGLKNFSRDCSEDPLTRVNLRSTLEDACNLCSEKLKESGVNLTLDCSPDITILARGSEISQITLNLLTNSHYAIQNQDSPWIHIRAAVFSDQVQIRFVDSGSGIVPEVADKIMQPFFTSKPVGEGTGLGLSISLGIAKAHGGDLQYLKGERHTTFLLTLPAQAKALASA